MTALILAIDQGTTNSRAIIFNQKGQPLAHHELPLKQFFPADGWVEQNALEMVENTIACCRAVAKAPGIDIKQIVAVGLTNQRETTIVWERATGQPIYPAIVWQDRRTSDACKVLSETSLFKHIQQKTGLRCDPYFSATKLQWILDHVDGARGRALKGELLFGTVDSFLLWHLSKEKNHLTDVTNASRTLLCNIHTGNWDAEVIEALNIPMQMLPKIEDNAAHFGDLHDSIIGRAIPIAGMAGDQQAATIGQACFQAGMAKITYGTGAFLLLNTGEKIIQSQNHLLSTIAYRIKQKTTYGLEGSIFSAGASIKWCRDKMQFITTAAESENFAKGLNDNGGVYFVPAFSGLGAPHWLPHARASIFGMTSDTNTQHIVRAALESVAYQTCDLMTAVANDLNKNQALQTPFVNLRVDGGMSANHWFLQFLANMVQRPIERPASIETTALGAAYLAGLQVGVFDSLNDIAEHWMSAANFQPENNFSREFLYANWQRAVNALMAWTG